MQGGTGQAGPQLEVWLIELEQALDALRTSCRLIETGAQPGPDFGVWAEDLRQAHAQIFLAYDREADSIHALVSARAHLDRVVIAAQSAASGDPVLSGVCDGFKRATTHLQRAEERVRTLIHLPPPAFEDQRAMVREPRLQRLDRARLTPHWRFPPVPKPEITVAPPEPLPQATTFDELEETIATLKSRAEARQQAAAERNKPIESAPETDREPQPPPGFARDPLPKLSHDEFAQQSARLCFEEVTMVGMARLPIFNQPWRTMEIFDQRMLNSIDAILALGPPALEQLEALVLDSPAPDPYRVWAISMVLGCVHGRDALAAAERTFYRVAMADDGAFEQFGRALKLVPHPSSIPLARKLLSHPQPTHRAVGMDVLIGYEAATPEELEWGAFAEPEVVAAALPAFALTKHARVRDAINRACTLPGATVRRSVWQAMAASADPRFTYTLHQDMQSELGAEATLWLGALGGQQDDAELFKLFSAGPTQPLIDALGWGGNASCIEPLMQVLKGKDPELALAAAFALERITGAGLFDEVEVPPEQLDEPEAPEPNTGEPLAELVSDPRDVPEPGSNDLMYFPTVDFNRWYRWWRDNSSRFSLGVRHRRGVQYSALVSWNELDQAPCTPGERRMLQQELIVRSGSFQAFDVEWFVPRQEAALVAWQPLARSASGRLGVWNTPGRR